MAAEPQALRRQIAEKRREIDQDLDQLQAAVAALTDWQRPLRDHPAVVVGTGMMTGLLLGWFLSRRHT